ncbi:MAG: FAD-binding protein [Syntrophales bacterium]|nr:FAD-binding protein [Syntrophales bacterium]
MSSFIESADSSEIGYEETDVVVAGASAGLVAAIKAADLGAKTICLDKLDPMDAEKIIPVAPAGIPGGWGNCTSKSGGAWYYMSNIAPDNPAMGIASIGSGGLKDLMVEFDEKTTTLQRYKDLSRGRTDIEVAKTLFERSKCDAKWLREEVGLLQEKASGVIAGKTARGRHILPDLYEAAKKKGVNILFKHKALKLLSDNRGRVTGIRAMTPQGLKDYRAKATILATGSFEGNHEMKLKYLGPKKAYMMLTGCPTNVGDGLRMATEMGAMLVNMTVTHIRTLDAVVYSMGPSRSIPNIYTRGLYINMNGKRFVDENCASDDIANSIAYQPDLRVYLIFDEKIKTEFSREYNNYIAKTIQDAYRPATEEELMIKANTIEELATKIAVAPSSLEATVKEFNAAVKDGKALAIPYPKMERAVKIEQPPFYAHPVTCALNHPLGGLKINDRGQVINSEDEIIPGLYACGAIVNIHFGEMIEIHGIHNYVSSYTVFAGLAYSFTTACLAAENAVKELE